MHQIPDPTLQAVCAALNNLQITLAAAQDCVLDGVAVPDDLDNAVAAASGFNVASSAFAGTIKVLLAAAPGHRDAVLAVEESGHALAAAAIDATWLVAQAVRRPK